MNKKSLFILFTLLIFYLNQAWANTSPVERIISLSPGTTELIASAGGVDKLVGVVAYSNYPKSVQNLPIVGNYNAISIEKIIALKPDLVVVWRSGNRAQDIARIEELSQKLGFKIFYSDPKSLFDIPKEIALIGEVIQTQDVAQKQKLELIQQLNSIKEQYQHLDLVTIFYQIWNHPFMTINGQQFISQALSLCGGYNIFSEMLTLAGTVSLEAIIHKNPQTILLGGEKPIQEIWLKEWQEWSTIQAIKQQQIYKINADNLQRPTARLIHYLPTLCQTIQQARTHYFHTP